jgi:uncharacterized circularly permuted ATP-grasp superfamily protein
MNGAFDEVFTDEGTPRDHAAALVGGLERLGPERLVAAGAQRDAIFMRHGIPFDLRHRGGEASLPASVVMTRLDPATSARA